MSTNTTIRMLFTVLLASLSITACSDSEFQGSAHRNSDDSKKGDSTSGDDQPLSSSDGTKSKKNKSGKDGKDDDGSNGLGGDNDESIDLGGDNDESDKGDDDDDGINIDESEIADKCDVPEGDKQQQTKLGGEDVPGNGLVGGPDAGKPFGGDFDDFFLTLDGSLLVEKDGSGAYAKIGSDKESKISVSYKRGTTDCSHAFKFIIRKCPNKKSTAIKTFTLGIGRGDTGSTTFTIPSGKTFLDIEITASASTTKQYGGCSLPIPITSLLYGGGVPVLVQ